MPEDPRKVIQTMAAAAEPGLVATPSGVNTGAIDPVGELCEIAHQHGAWVHVDGAFGPWAGASPGSGRWWPAWSWPTPGRPTRTSGSTCHTTRAWCSAPSPRRTGPPWASAPATSSTAPKATAMPSTTTRSSRAAPAGSRSMPPSARWAAPASPSWSSGAARWLADIPRQKCPIIPPIIPPMTPAAMIEGGNRMPTRAPTATPVQAPCSVGFSRLWTWTLSCSSLDTIAMS